MKPPALRDSVRQCPSLMVMLMLLSIMLLGTTSCASDERQQFYTDQNGPYAEKNGFTLRLISFDQDSSHLHATIQVSNASTVVVELPAQDLVTTWLDVVIAGKTYAGRLSYTDPDDLERQHWPDTRPLRRIVTLQPYQAKTYFVDCEYPAKRANVDSPAALIAQVLAGPDKQLWEARLDFPSAPSRSSH